MLFDAARSLLLIDADQALHRLANIVATRAGWRVQAVTGVEAALATVRNDAQVTAAVMSFPQENAEMFASLLAERENLTLIAIGDKAASVSALRAGASDILTSPVAPDRLVAALNNAADRRGRRSELRPIAEKIAPPLAFDEMIGSAPAFRAALAAAAKAARSRMPVLIEGERGTGKQMIALAIHNAGPRASGPLISLDCNGIPPSHVETALFGYEKGAFPGAFERKAGRIEDADGGTLYIGDVGGLSPQMQTRLLRFLETGEVQRIGSRGFKTPDTRIIAGSYRSLLDDGHFGQDLHRRLSPAHVRLPPLRERRSDIPALARHLLARIAEQPGLRPLGITDEALSVLMSYGWPGNIRQLQDALFRAALGCQGNAITLDDLPRIALESTLSNRADDHHAPLARSSAALVGSGVTLFQADGHLRSLEEIETDIIRLAIGRYNGRMTEVARRLGIGRSTLYRKLAELGISDAA